MQETEKMWKFSFPELTVLFPQARCGELLRSKYLYCQTPFCLHISFYRYFVNQLKPQALESTEESTKTTSTWKHIWKNQLKPQALENTYERTLKLQWLFTIAHRNTHELNRTLSLYKLTAFHRSYKLMTLTKSSRFRPPYYHRCWRTWSWLMARCVSNGYCHSSAIC
jgi:hypothetical protein